MTTDIFLLKLLHLPLGFDIEFSNLYKSFGKIKNKALITWETTK